MDEDLRSQFLIVARDLLLRHRKPMSAQRLTHLAFNEGLFSDQLSGQTPAQTMKAKLSVHIRRRGEASVFVRTGPGIFYLRKLPGGHPPPYEAPPLRVPEARETVLVVPVQILDAAGRFQGILKKWKPHYKSLLKSNALRTLDRYVAEGREDVKQILTYILVVRDGSILGFKRGVFNRVEEMLRGAQCIGFGGHVRDKDVTLFSEDEAGVRESAARELAEEIETARSDFQELSRRLEIVGLLNDDSSAVGRRHCAVVLRCDVTGLARWENPRRGEKSITQLRWIDPASEDPPLRDFEYWSQLCLRTFFDNAVAGKPDFTLRRRSLLRAPNLICVTGEIGSGKSEAVRVMADEFGYDEINSGRVLADLMGIPPVPKTPRKTFHKRAWSFISTRRGPERLAAALAKEVAKSGSERIVIDGLRQIETFKALRRLVSHRTGVVFVHTPADIAFELYRKREAKSPIPPLEFFALRESPVECGVRDFIGLADAVVYNWVGRESYRNVVRRLMAEAKLPLRRISSE